jgi:hypothetical protein
MVRRLSLLSVTIVLVVVIPIQLSLAQTAPKKCAPVTPKNPQEALMLEQSTNKNGCYVRDSKGTLVFVSSRAPDENYIPTIDIPQVGSCKPALGSPSRAALGLAGTWKFAEGTYPGEAELALSRRVGGSGSIRTMNNCQVNDVQNLEMTLSRMPDGRFCTTTGGAGESCFVPSGAGAYLLETANESCKFVLDRAVLRGACFDKYDTGRVTLFTGTRGAP